MKYRDNRTIPIHDCLSLFGLLYFHPVAVEGTPDASYTVVGTLDWLLHLPQLFPGGIPQQLRLLQNLKRFHVLDADRLVPAVDVVPDHDGMLRGSRGDCELDLGVGGDELRENRLDKATEELCESLNLKE